MSTHRALPTKVPLEYECKKCKSRTPEKEVEQQQAKKMLQSWQKQFR